MRANGHSRSSVLAPEERQLELADLEHVPVIEGLWLGQLALIDIGPVEAADIADMDGFAVELGFCMAPRNRDVVEEDRAVGVAAERRYAGVKLIARTTLWATADHEAHHFRWRTGGNVHDFEHLGRFVQQLGDG